MCIASDSFIQEALSLKWTLRLDVLAKMSHRHASTTIEPRNQF